LRIHGWSGRRYDKRASQYVAVQHDAATNAGRYNKRLLPKAALAALNATLNEARKTHYHHTLPWDDVGARLLPVANYERYTTALDRLIERMGTERQRFIADYDNQVERARLDLGRAAVAVGVRCAIDISDGLLQDLGHVARASGVGIELDAAALPLHPAATALLDAENALELALRGGEDYELALTAPAATLGALPPAETTITTIGRVVAAHPGEVVALGGDGRPLAQPSGGWDQLRTARG